MHRHKVSLSDKVFTENPLLDEIVYNARQLATETVVKDSDKADRYESKESAINGDVLIAINNGTINFNNFYYDEDILSQYYASPEKIKYFAGNNDAIPKTDRLALTKIASKEFLKNYEEENHYYRLLHGLPTYKYDRIGIPVWKGLWVNPDAIDDFSQLSFENISSYQKDKYVLVQDLNLAQKNILYEGGTCEAVVNDDTWLANNQLEKEDVMYLMHIGDREIDYYDARVADKFGMLYCPPCDSNEVRSRFKDIYEANRMYLFYTSYSEAYKYKSDYYDNFMMIFLILQTVIDMMVELPEYIIRRDIFDTRTCKYIFESNGVKYFKDIPLNFQINLVKNLNKLIKFKSTDKCIVDIISIFGIDSIEVFRYYIMKDRRVDNIKDLDYYNNTKVHTDTLGNKTILEDNQKNYDIRFIKVPMLKTYDEYIRKDANIRDYDTITETDRYWIGDRDYDAVLRDIKDLDFTVLRSKYYSIEAVIDLAKRNFTVVYFMNILMYNKIDKSLLQINLPNISNKKKFELVDAILTLYSLSYIYYGVEDTIIDTRSKAATILGFNMEADLAKISTWLYENHMGLTLKDLKVDTFQVPENGRIMSFKELENIFLKNKDCYDHIRSVMRDPPSKEIYDAYKFLYKSLLITNRNMEYFLVGNNLEVDKYKRMGYTTKFLSGIPTVYEYTNPKDYERDYKWLLESIGDKELCFNMDKNFDENHKFELYIKENGDLKLVGSAQMAYTYKEFLRYKDPSLYSFLIDILNINNMESRREACVNAIQAITSYIKDYINRDVVDLDTVFSGLPSVSLDFIKRYVEEVIDFFKSFKIFTHGSSIVYIIDDKFDNYVQLIDHIMIGHLFDKSEIIRIEDALGGKVENINGLLMKAGNGLTTNISHDEKMGLIDKVWFDISTWVKKNYKDFYNSDEYKESEKRIKDSMERYSTYTLSSNIFTEKYIREIENYAVDAILNCLVTITKEDSMGYKDHIHTHHTFTFDDKYKLWLTDLAKILVHITTSDKMHYQDDYTSMDLIEGNSVSNIFDTVSNSTSLHLRSSMNIVDDYYMIHTQEFPPHEFDA